MHHRIAVNGRTLDVESIETDGPESMEIDVNGNVHDVNVRSSSHGRHLVVVDGRARVMFARCIQGATWIWCKGRAFKVEDLGKKSRSSTPAPQGESGSVTPPMPAVVAEVLVQVGDEVEKGQDLVVVTAMKMETRLSANRTGRISAVNTEVGASVMPGDVLVDIEEETDG